MSEPNSTRAYPNEIASIVRQQTFFIDSFLSVASSNDGYDNAPLMMYGHFSRYRFYIINKEHTRAFANISASGMQTLIDLSRAIYPEYIKATLLGGASDKKGDDAAHPAYSVTFSSGTLKGQTPAQVLLRDGDKGVDTLRDQYKFLRDHVDKYPRNKTVMDAITDAVNLYKAGQLSADSAASGGGKRVTLFDAQLRPLVRNQRADGMSFVYNAKITWDFGAQAPITIAIENYYAPVEHLNDGRLNVRASQRDQSSVVSNVMNLSVDEWMWCMNQAAMDMRRFEIVNAKRTWDDAQKAIAREREAYNAQRQGGNDADAQPSYSDDPGYGSDMPYAPDDDAVFSEPEGDWA